MSKQTAEPVDQVPELQTRRIRVGTEREVGATYDQMIYTPILVTPLQVIERSVSCIIESMAGLRDGWEQASDAVDSILAHGMFPNLNKKPEWVMCLLAIKKSCLFLSWIHQFIQDNSQNPEQAHAIIETLIPRAREELQVLQTLVKDTMPTFVKDSMNTSKEGTEDATKVTVPSTQKDFE